LNDDFRKKIDKNLLKEYNNLVIKVKDVEKMNLENPNNPAALNKNN
jgi:hypothetical protein